MRVSKGFVMMELIIALLLLVQILNILFFLFEVVLLNGDLLL